MMPILFISFISILICTFDVNAKYHWQKGMKHMNVLSSIVALEYGNDTIGTGVFITQSSILTSANILDYMAANGSSYTHIKVHSVWGPETQHWVWCIRTIHTFNRYRSSTTYWVRQGFDRKHSPMHDLYVLGLMGTWKDDMFLMEPLIAIPRDGAEYADYKEYDFWGSTDTNFWKFNCFKHDLRPVTGTTPRKAIRPSQTLHSKDMFYAGFACCNNGTFEDKDHTLRIETEISLVDCDEWVPREWGYFICVSIKDETSVPSAGTPLFYKKILVGLASFTMTRNEETIQVFTDMRPYYPHLWVCKPFHMSISSYYKWRYTSYITYYILPAELKHTYRIKLRPNVYGGLSLDPYEYIGAVIKKAVKSFAYELLYSNSMLWFTWSGYND